jgi:hypothetical protein
MTPFDEGKLLRREVAQLRQDKRRRYPEALRRRILNWVGRATDEGAKEHECAKAIGVKAWRFTVWRRREAREAEQERRALDATCIARDEAEPLALVAIEVPALAALPAPTLVTPSGYRVEGLSLAQLVTLLRELA